MKEAIKVVAKKPPAEILQAIDQDFDQLLAHLENRDQLVSQYKEKLAQFQEAFEKNQSDLSYYIDHLKIEGERLNQLFSEVNGEDEGFFAELLKQYLNYQSLIDQKEAFDQKINRLEKLLEKVTLVASGIGLLNGVDKQEITTFRHWHVMIKQAPLKTL